MALKRLTSAEMVQISGPWTTEGSASRKALLSTPELAGIVPKIDAAHAALHAARPVTDDPRLATISAQAGELDDRHDALVRGADQLLDAIALLLGPGERADELQAARAALAPQGLAITQTSYRNEAGAAALLASRLKKEGTLKSLLQSIVIDKKRTLATFVNERIHTAEQLGTLEDQRAMLLAQAPPEDATRNVDARNAWIRAVNALVANAALADLKPDVDSTIFSALRHAEKKADARGKAAPEDTGDGTPQPVPPPGPAAPPPPGGGQTTA